MLGPSPSLAALPDDVIVRIIQILLACSVLDGAPSFDTPQCPHVCALSAVSRRLQRLVGSVLNNCHISLHDLSHYSHNYNYRHPRCTAKRQDTFECKLCHKAVSRLAYSAIQSFSSTRSRSLCVVPACQHDASSLITAAVERFCPLNLISIIVPQANYNTVVDSLTPENSEVELNTDDSQSAASTLADIMPNLSRVVHLTLQLSTSQYLLNKMSRPNILPYLRTVELVLPSSELVPALLLFLSQPDRVLNLRDVRCSIQPCTAAPSQYTYACEYSQYTGPKKQIRTDVMSKRYEDFSTAQLASHLLKRLSAFSIAVSIVNASSQSAIDTPDESYSCAHCGLDKNADVRNPYSPYARHLLYSANIIKPLILTGGNGWSFRASFSTHTAYGNVLSNVLPSFLPIQCVVASRNVARIVKPTFGYSSTGENGNLHPPVVATSLRGLFPCFPPRYDHLSGKEDLSQLKMLDVATTTIERDPFSTIPSLVQTLQIGEAGEFDSAMSTVGHTLDSIRVRPFPRAWHHAQEADKSLTLRVLYSAPKVRIFDVYICVLCSFIRQSQLDRLFIHMGNLQILHVSESPPGFEPSTVTEQPDLITALRTIPRLLSALLKSCDALRLVMWHATHTCRLPCTGCREGVTFGSLTRSFGSPLGHALHALQRFKEKRPHVNTDSLQKCLDRLIVR